MAKLLLEDLPLELIWDITSYLDEVDQQCVRLVSSRLRKCIKLPPHPPSFLDFKINSYNEKRFEFVERLFRPGNIYDSERYSACLGCLRVRAIECFPMPSLRVEGHRVCEDCILEVFRKKLGPGRKQTYRNKFDYYTCAKCGEGDTEPAMHVHNEFQGNQRLCAACHKNNCTNPDCEGWPEGFVRSNWYHFYNRPGLDGEECYCDICEDYRY